MMTVDEQRALGEIHPDLKRLLDSGSFPRMVGWRKGAAVKDGRQFLRFLREQQRALMPQPSKRPWIEVESEIQVPNWSPSSTTPQVTLKIKVHKPRKIPKGGCPGMISFAAGGFLLRDFEMAAPLCHQWTRLGGIAIDIGYRLAPEDPFPTAPRDCYEGLKWVAANYQDLGLNPDKGFIVAGESNGADLALVAAHLYAQEELSPKLTGIYASMPWGVNKETVPEKYKDRLLSFEQCANAPQTLDLEGYEFNMEHYKPDPTSPLAFPVAFPDHSGLPRTYFQVCGLDPVRDCGLILEQVLKDAGVETKMDVYPGLTHAAWVAFDRFPWAAQAIPDSSEGLKWLLRKSG